MMISKRTEVTAATTTACLAVPWGAPWAAASIRPSSTQTAARVGWDFSNAEISEDQKNTDVDRGRRAAELMNPLLSLHLPGWTGRRHHLLSETSCFLACCGRGRCWFHSRASVVKAAVRRGDFGAHLPGIIPVKLSAWRQHGSWDIPESTSQPASYCPWWPCNACSSVAWCQTADPARPWLPGAMDTATGAVDRWGRRSCRGRTPCSQDGSWLHSGKHLAGIAPNSLKEDGNVNCTPKSLWEMRFGLRICSKVLTWKE